MAILNSPYILVVNAGSSSLKLTYFGPGGRQNCSQKEASDLAEGIRSLNISDINAIGHRVVHGGRRFTACTRIDEETLAELEQLNELAPLHNPASLEAIKICQKLYPSIPQYACFDTAFHHTMPEHARYYAIPLKWMEEWGIQRYGFHGLSHSYLWKTYHKHIGKGKIITAHLGSGCSLAAIKEGQSIDTSMGFTPLEGVMMGTRSGDIDPSVVEFLGHKLNKSAEEVVTLLNKECGLLGLSGETSAMDKLLTSNSPQAKLAIDLFCYRIIKTIGAYCAALQGADALVFSGGIGENAPAIRQQIVEGLGWLNAEIDPALNSQPIQSDLMRISTGKSRLAIYVIPTDENSAIRDEVVSSYEVR